MKFKCTLTFGGEVVQLLEISIRVYYVKVITTSLVDKFQRYKQKRTIDENDSVMKGYMTISFSYVYLKGLHLGIGPSSPVVIDVHRLNLQPNVTKTSIS